MSGKVQKQLRKLARQELEKRMDQNKPQPPNPGLQIINFLENFIQLSVQLTGEKPTSIILTDVMYNAYIQESQRHGEILGLQPGFKTGEPEFSGVKLEKRSPLIVPPPVAPEVKAN